MGLTVLVADGSDFDRDLLRQVLEPDHEVVGEAENGVEAIERFEEHRPDLVVMEITMPITDGIEATASIKESAPDSAIIVCTSVPAEERLDDALEAGADAYITKPYQEHAVKDAIDAVVG